MIKVFRKLLAFLVSDLNARPKNVRVADVKDGKKFATLKVDFDPSCEYLGMKLVSLSTIYWKATFWLCSTLCILASKPKNI